MGHKAQFGLIWYDSTRTNNPSFHKKWNNVINAHKKLSVDGEENQWKFMNKVRKCVYNFTISNTQAHLTIRVLTNAIINFYRVRSTFIKSPNKEIQLKSRRNQCRSNQMPCNRKQGQGSSKKLLSYAQTRKNKYHILKVWNYYKGTDSCNHKFDTCF